MNKPVVEVQIRGLAATSGVCAVFLGNEEKVFAIYVEQSVGLAIALFMQGTKKERPLTHDLLANILRAFEAKIERVIVNDGCPIPESAGAISDERQCFCEAVFYSLLLWLLTA